jgi:hypothetical protein
VFFFFKEQNFVKEDEEDFEMIMNYYFFNMEPLKLINYLIDMCSSCPPCTMVPEQKKLALPSNKP